jgi:hypothetical protein
MNARRWAFLAWVTLALAGCSSSKRWTYEYERGKTAVIIKGNAVPPAGLPEKVMKAIAAGNRLAGKPYRRGGGHGSFEDSAYDCSGVVSYVLHAVDKLESPTTSSALTDFGSGGEGEWITIYAKNGHTFIEVAGLRLDTGWHGEREGPRWTTKSRPIDGYVTRHPSGL